MPIWEYEFKKKFVQSFGKGGRMANFVRRDKSLKNPKKRNCSTLKHKLNAFPHENNKA